MRVMPLPDTIPVKYTEEEAEYASIRPLVQQQFRGRELLDMIVRVAGKDPARVGQILRSGTVVFHSYRYWWQGFDPGEPEIREVLAKYPDPDFSRPFRAEDCSEVILESSGMVASHSIHFRRDEARKRRFLRSRSFWDYLMDLSHNVPPAYREYSYSVQADLYSAPLSREQVARMALDAKRYATRSLRAQLTALSQVSQIVYACPR